ncbi:MAG: type IV pilin protein [Halieaceae bacterium]|nr:type IV pilin protein [Halieaceae bacterium]
MTPKRERGFTLIEILIALVVLAILMAVALPGYNSQVTRSNRNDCMGVMLGFAQAMEKHRALNYTYLGAADGGDTGTPANTLHPAQCPIDGTALYNLTIVSATATEFTLQAAPVAGRRQAGDGPIRINHLGQRFWDRNSDGFGAGDNTWKTD